MKYEELSLLEAYLLMMDDESRVFETKTEFPYKYKVENGILKMYSFTTDSWINSLLDVNTMSVLDAREVIIPFKDRVLIGDTYYILSGTPINNSLGVGIYEFSNDYLDRCYIRDNNFFETEEEAIEKMELIKKKVKEILEN